MISERVTVTLAELEEHWSLLDMAHAHAVLDAIDDANARAKRAAETLRPGGS